MRRLKQHTNTLANIWTQLANQQLASWSRLGSARLAKKLLKWTHLFKRADQSKARQGKAKQPVSHWQVPIPIVIAISIAIAIAIAISQSDGSRPNESYRYALAGNTDLRANSDAGGPTVTHLRLTTRAVR